MRKRLALRRMKIERYHFEDYTERYYYEFCSVGPKGTIRKLVIFTLTEDRSPPTYDLSFGDRKGMSLDIDDKIVTNNNDSSKVLQTVALVVKFLNHDL